MKKDNPFSLTFGKLPDRYINRYEDMTEVVSMFDADHPVAQTYLIQGVRGSGKTVFMTSISKTLTENDHWMAIDLNVSYPLLHDMALRLNDLCGERFDLGQRGMNVSLGGVGFGIGNGSDERDDVSLITRQLEVLKKKEIRLLITIDEVVPGENLRTFVSQFQIFLRQDYPVFLIMTGLYENIYGIQNDPILTFLLRSPKLTLEPLSIRQIVQEYRNSFGIDTEQARELAYITDGYAFAFQALGMLMWEYKDSLSMEEIKMKLDDLLDDYVYKKIWEGMTKKEKEIILAINGNDPVKTADICEMTHSSASTFSKYKERLEKRGILASPSHGYVTVKLPRFCHVVQDYKM